jgi:uncharacterized membrane protein YsdA (DUF1294 family)
MVSMIFKEVGMVQFTLSLIILSVVNLLSLALFGIDKLSSVKRGWRIPESSLLLAALVGPFGAFAGMLIFRHKTRKMKFILVPIFLILQLVLLVYLNLV